MITNYNQFIKDYNSFRKSESGLIYNKTVFKSDIEILTPDSLKRDNLGKLIDVEKPYIYINISDFGNYSRDEFEMVIYIDGLLIPRDNYYINFNDSGYIDVFISDINVNNHVELMVYNISSLGDYIIYDQTNTDTLTIDLYDFKYINGDIFKEYKYKIKSLDDLLFYFKSGDEFIKLTDYDIKYKNHTNTELFTLIQDILKTDYAYDLIVGDIDYDIFHNYQKYFEDVCPLTHILGSDTPAIIATKKANYENIMTKILLGMKQYGTIEVKFNVYNIEKIYVFNRNRYYRKDDVLTINNFLGIENTDVKRKDDVVDKVDIDRNEDEIVDITIDGFRYDSLKIKTNQRIDEKPVDNKTDVEFSNTRDRTFYKINDIRVLNANNIFELDVYIDGIKLTPRHDYEYDTSKRYIKFYRKMELGSKISLIHISSFKDFVNTLEDPNLYTNNEYENLYTNMELIVNVRNDSIYNLINSDVYTGNFRTSQFDYDFNSYGIFVLHSLFPISSNNNIEIYQSGKKVPNDNINFIRHNLIYVNGLIGTDNIFIKYSKTNNDSYQSLHKFTNSELTITSIVGDNYVDNINLENVVNTSDVLYTEWINKKKLLLNQDPNVNNNNISRYRYLPEFRSYVLDNASEPYSFENLEDIVNDYISTNSLKQINVTDNIIEYNIPDPRLRVAINDNFNKYSPVKKYPFLDRVSLASIINFLEYYDLDLEDYRIKSIKGFDNINFKLLNSILLNKNKDLTINLKNNEIKEFKFNIFSDLTPRYIEPKSGTDLDENEIKCSIDLRNNPLIKSLQYLIRKIYIEKGFDIIYDDDLIVFTDENLRKYINGYMIDNFKDDDKLNPFFKLTDDNDTLFYNKHKFLSVNNFNDISINLYQDTLDNTLNILKINYPKNDSNDTILTFDGVEECHNIHNINLSGHGVTNITPGKEWDNLRRLIVLDISNNELGSILFIRNIVSLIQLNVSNNHIHTGEYDFSKYRKLKYLDISYNSIGSNDQTSTDDMYWFDYYNNLRYLNITRTKIRQISRIFNMDNLITFIADDINLTDISLSMYLFIESPRKVQTPNVLPNMRNLSLRKNNISNFNLLKLDRMINLKELYLDNNNIGAVFNINNTYNLEILSLSDNSLLSNITITGSNICNNFKSLYVNNTSISSISSIDNFYNKDKIEIIELRNTLISDVTTNEIIDRFNKNTIIDLRDNTLNTPTQRMLDTLNSNGWHILFDGTKVYLTTPGDTSTVVLNKKMPIQTKNFITPRFTKETLYVKDEYVNQHEVLSVLDVLDDMSENITLKIKDEYKSVILEAIEINIYKPQYYNIGEIVKIDANGDYELNMDATSSLSITNPPTTGLINGNMINNNMIN